MEQVIILLTLLLNLTLAVINLLNVLLSKRKKKKNSRPDK